MPAGTPIKRRTLSFSELWNMSFGFLGIQFGFALQNANVSRIFQTLGAELDNIAILWLAAPITGLLVQPVIGYISDRTWLPFWGRRRPFFFIGAVLASIARSEEHTSELQSRENLVCRLLLEKKKLQ